MKTVLALACGLLLCASGLSAQITSIPAANLINPQVLDFDTGAPPPPGTISGTDPYFLAIGLSQVSLVGATTAGGDQLDTYPQGNALCAVNNQLAIVAPNTPMDNIPAGAGWSFQINGTATQIGFNSVDQNGHSIDIQAFSLGQPVGNLVITWTFTTNTQYYQSAVPFDEVRLVSSGSTSGWGLDNVTFGNLQTGPPPPASYQVNSPVASLDIDGVTGSPYTPAIVNKTTYICGGAPAPVTSVYTLGSNLPGNLFDIVTSGLPLVSAAAGGGGLPLADGQFINIDLFGGPFSFVSGGVPLTLPLSHLPGINEVSLSVVTSTATATTASAQAVVFDSTAPLGYRLSQGVELNVAVLPAQPSVAGPTSVTGTVSIDVVNPPTCWSSAGGVPFYGAMFSTINVSASGGVQFGGTDTDTSPSLLDAFGDDGRVGFWTALDPSEGGTVTISSPMQDIIRVDWAGVFYDANTPAGPGVTFGIQFDCVTGVITMDGLQGIAPNPTLTTTTDDQMLLISPGITFTGTTIPPPAGFGLAQNGSGTWGLDMLYEFNDVSATMMGVPASIAGGMNVLTFTPTTLSFGSSYLWAGT